MGAELVGMLKPKIRFFVELGMKPLNVLLIWYLQF